MFHKGASVETIKMTDLNHKGFHMDIEMTWKSRIFKKRTDIL